MSANDSLGAAAMFGTPPAGTLTRLLRHAHQAGAVTDAVPLLTLASRFTPAFTDAADLAAPPRSILVSDGSALPVLICLPSFLAGSGPHQFIRLASAFEHRSRTVAVVLPGFERNSAMPGSWNAALNALARSVRQTAGEQPFVLVGHSIGGVLAHALAERLDSTDTPAAGIVMIDTLDPREELRQASLDWALDSVLSRDSSGIVVNDDNLLAMGAYLRIFEDWRRGTTTAPTLLVSAEQHVGKGTDRWPAWVGADSVVSLDADHFSILDERASATAKLIEAWLPETGADVR